MRRAGDRHLSGRMLSLKALLGITALVLFLFALYAAGRRLETGLEGQPVRGDLQTKVSDAPRITYDGVVYEPKELTTVLVMGVDKSTPSGGFRSGGQADFLLVFLIDNENKNIVPLQIDRDTMTEITVLGVLGGKAGTRNAQICLSHGFGDGNAQSCLLTQQAVSNLLLGTGIDYYLAMNLDGIQALNEAVGGVTVTLEEDFSALDPAMRKGVTLTLHGEQAGYYVRNRRDIGSGTNEGRMDRQKVYLKGLSERLRAQFHDNYDSMGGLYDVLKPYLQTNMTRGRIINEAWKTRDYQFAEIVRPEGNHSVGEDGFMEFHADEAALQKLVMDLFYQTVQ